MYGCVVPKLNNIFELYENLFYEKNDDLTT